MNDLPTQLKTYLKSNDFILFPITKIDDVKKVRVILRKTKDDYNFVITQERCNKELYRRIWNSDVFLSNFMLTQRFFLRPFGLRPWVTFTAAQQRDAIQHKK